MYSYKFRPKNYRLPPSKPLSILESFSNIITTQEAFPLSV